MNQDIRTSKGFAKSPVPTPWSAETQLARQRGYVGIAGSGDFVHAVYSGFSETNNPVLYRRSTNEGESFTEDPIQLDPNGRANALKFENFKQVAFIPTSFLAFG